MKTFRRLGAVCAAVTILTLGACENMNTNKTNTANNGATDVSTNSADDVLLAELKEKYGEDFECELMGTPSIRSTSASYKVWPVGDKSKLFYAYVRLADDSITDSYPCVLFRKDYIDCVLGIIGENFSSYKVQISLNEGDNRPFSEIVNKDTTFDQLLAMFESGKTNNPVRIRINLLIPNDGITDYGSLYDKTARKLIQTFGHVSMELFVLDEDVYSDMESEHKDHTDNKFLYYYYGIDIEWRKLSREKEQREKGLYFDGFNRDIYN